jgi:hypothetical protein
MEETVPTARRLTTAIEAPRRPGRTAPRRGVLVDRHRILPQPRTAAAAVPMVEAEAASMEVVEAEVVMVAGVVITKLHA